jgi:hypothetical protein
MIRMMKNTGQQIKNDPDDKNPCLCVPNKKIDLPLPLAALVAGDRAVSNLAAAPVGGCVVGAVPRNGYNNVCALLYKH